jgi:hypothetical protein
MNSNWLDQLAPEHAPPPPGWWPPAPGWWVLAALVLGAVIFAALWWRDPRGRLRRATLRELRRTRAADLTIGESAQAIQNLLRRYALAVFGAETVARLNGAPWLAFLAEHGAPAFAGPMGRSLLAVSYGGEADGADREAWFTAAERFVRRAKVHKAAPKRGRLAGKRHPRGRPA